MYGVCVSVERRERVDRRNKSGPLVWGGGGGGGGGGGAGKHFVIIRILTLIPLEMSGSNIKSKS